MSNQFELSGAVWRKASASQGPTSNCVEIAGLGSHVAVRDSKNRRGPVLAFGAPDWAAFVTSIRNGDLDA